MLQRLTLVQHLLLLVLTSVCVVRALTTGASVTAVLLSTTAFLAWYLLGAVWAQRSGTTTSRGPASSPVASATVTSAMTASGQSLPQSRRAGLLSQPRSSGRAMGWLVVLTALWLGLVAVSPQNAWIAFCLWLLAGHVLPLRWAVVHVVFSLSITLAALWQVDGSLSIPELIGPSTGAVFALVLSRAQFSLVNDAIERQRLLDSLMLAQAETEELHADLAASQREAGALAERARLSRDIHDTLAQGFSSIVLLARAGLTSDRPAELLTQIEQTASTNLDEARRVVGALAPAALDGSGLAAALRRLLDGLAAETEIDTDLRLDGDLSGLPTTIEVALLRTAQGALANVRRHSRATKVVVSLAEVGDAVRLDVVDDGVGFDPDEASARTPSPIGGYGLRSTKARLRELGGGLEVESSPGEGTALSAHLPLLITGGRDD